MADASLFFLSALVDKAYLRRQPSGRYEMHELLRQYAELSPPSAVRRFTWHRPNATSTPAPATGQ